MTVYVQRRRGCEKRGLFQKLGFRQPTTCWIVHSRWELAAREQQLLETHPELKQWLLFRERKRGRDRTWRVEAFIELGMFDPAPEFVTDDIVQLEQLESAIWRAARQLKARLEVMAEIRALNQRAAIRRGRRSFFADDRSRTPV